MDVQKMSSNGSPLVQPRSSSLLPKSVQNGLSQRSDYALTSNSMLKNCLERRGSSQSVSSRSSLQPKSVTFCERVSLFVFRR
jgi:hypothetical protein